MDAFQDNNVHHADPCHGVVQALNALGRFLKFQKSLDNPSVTLGADACQILETWGTQGWPPAPFMALGPEDARIVLVDSEGTFFNAEPGDLLVKMLSAMHLTPAQVYICNAVDNAELSRHIEANTPSCVVAFGEKACWMMKGTKEPLIKVRGHFFGYKEVPVMPTWHPSVLVKNPALKRQAWEDLKQVMTRAGLDGHDS